METIAAIATPAGRGGHWYHSYSGPLCSEIARSCWDAFQSLDKLISLIFKDAQSHIT